MKGTYDFADHDVAVVAADDFDAHLAGEGVGHGADGADGEDEETALHFGGFGGWWVGEGGVDC